MTLKKLHIFRLKPNQNLNEGILEYCLKNKIKSGIVLSMLGSLNNANLGFLKKLPGKYISKKFTGPLEIVNGTGSIAQMDGKTLIHVHIEISNEKMAIGGHLIEAEIFSTAEIVIGELKENINRKHDKFTGLNELV